MMKLKQLLIVLFGGIAACGSSKSQEQFTVQNGDTLHVVKEYDKEGHLKAEKFVDNDNLIQGSVKMFYQNGALQAELSFTDSKKNGIEKSYYPSGKIKHIGVNNLGKQDSTWIWLYEDGTTEEVSNWINGASHGEDISYYENGRIKMFRFYYFGDLMYIREYDNNGGVVKEDGKIPMGVAYNKNNLKVGDVYNAKVLIGLLPNWDATLQVIDLSNGKNKIIKEVKSKSGFDKALWGKLVVVDERVSKVGNYKWLINATVVDEENKKMQYSDTLNYTVLQ